MNIRRFIKEDLSIKRDDVLIVKMDIESSEWPVLKGANCAFMPPCFLIFFACLFCIGLNQAKLAWLTCTIFLFLHSKIETKQRTGKFNTKVLF